MVGQSNFMRVCERPFIQQMYLVISASLKMVNIVFQRQYSCGLGFRETLFLENDVKTTI